MKILVTGANGYLGQGIVSSILESGREVIATDLQTDFVDCHAERINGDIFEMKNPYEELGEPDILLHLAWREGFVHYSDAHIEDLPKHFSFVKKMAAGGISQIAVMGSMHEIGFWEGSVDESTPCHPVTPYGIGKNALRDLTQMICEQNDIVFQWLRGYYIVGNSGHGNSIFSKITLAEREGKEEFPFTWGQNQYDFIDYEDFCRQVACTVNQRSEHGIINICSGRPEKLADRVERFIQENHYKIRLEYGAFPDRSYDSKAIWGNDQKIQRILGESKC